MKCYDTIEVPTLRWTKDVDIQLNVLILTVD